VLGFPARARDALLFCYLAVAWGGSYTAIEVGLAHAPPVLFSALRYDLAAVALLAYVAVIADPGHRVPRSREDLGAVLVTGVLIVGAGSVLLFLGQTLTTGSVASMVFSLNPVLAAAFARALLPDERFGPLGMLGLLLGLAGVALIVRPSPDALLDGRALGELLVLAAAVAVALGSVLVRRTPAAIDSTAVAAWGMVVGALSMHAASLLRGEPRRLPGAPVFYLALAYVAVVAAAGTYAVYFALLERIGAVQVNLVSYATPPVAVVTGALLLGERVAPLSLAGFAVVAVGFALLKRRALRGLLRGPRSRRRRE